MGTSIRILVGLTALILYLPDILLACTRSLLNRQAEFLIR